MKRCRCHRAIAPLGALIVAVAVAGSQPGLASASLKPTGDIVERFAADPLGEPRWYANGSWVWEPQGTTLAAQGPHGNLLWTAGSHFTGTLSLRFRLGGPQSRARLLFAHDPATGASRWVEVAAGSPGRIALGQTGTIRGSAAGVIQSWRAPVAAGAWQDLALRIAADKSVTLTLGGVQLFSSAVAPLAPGLVGFGADGPVSFDEFAFAADPDGEPCVECHSGQPEQPAAANVYAWWDGRRWDALHGGDPAEQQGGHGDPGGVEYPFPGFPPEPVATCTGTRGCHDLRQPVPEDHRNGTREGRGHRSLNSFHLRTVAIVAQPANPNDAQVAFDVNFCYLLCHSAQRITSDLHAAKVRLRVAGESLPLPVDSDITTRALGTKPDYLVCVSCHDPHGTGVTDNKGTSNEMLRMDWFSSSTLCDVCH